jgi:predicted nucleic acid-binding protein
MTDARAFVDTNVLLRALYPQMKLHQEARSLIRRMWDDGIELWISRQVLREFIAQATHPKTIFPPTTIVEVMTQIDVAQTLFFVADETQAVTDQLLFLLRTYSTYGKQTHDANIIATMLTYQINTLLTMECR